MFDHKFHIKTDASKLGLRAELFQTFLEGTRFTIFLDSRTLSSAEFNNYITELQLLSIVLACQKFRVNILGYPINVLTDH